MSIRWGRILIVASVSLGLYFAWPRPTVCFENFVPVNVTVIVLNREGQPIPGASVWGTPPGSGEVAPVTTVVADRRPKPTGPLTDPEGMYLWRMEVHRSQLEREEPLKLSLWVRADGYWMEEVLVSPQGLKAGHWPAPLRVEVRLRRLTEGIGGDAIQAAEAVLSGAASR